MCDGEWRALVFIRIFKGITNKEAGTKFLEVKLIMDKCVKIIEVEDKFNYKNEYSGKEVFYVSDSHVFKFPCKYMKVDLYLKLRGHKFREKYLTVHKILTLDDDSNRIDRPWRYLGNYKWIYAAIIGIISNKKIIVYPYIRKGEMPYRIVRLNLLIQLIKEQKLLLIVPVEKETDISQLEIE